MGNLTLKDLADSQHYFLAVDDLNAKITCLGIVTNPRTGRKFKVGDVVGVRHADVGLSGEFVRLVGVTGIFDLRAFRMPTEHDLRKALIATVDSPKDHVDGLKKAMKDVSEALDAGGYGKECSHVVCGQTKDEKCRDLKKDEPFVISAVIREAIEKVGCDQEIMVRSRIETGIRMGIAAYRATRVRADAPAMASAINGIANGVAVEVIQTLGLQPSYANLRPAHVGEPVNGDPPADIPREGLGGGHGA